MNAKKRKAEPEYEPHWDADKGPSDEQVNTAMRVLRSEYFTSVRYIAREITDRLKAEPDSEVSDLIHEACDECYWTIYTAASQRAVLCSDCDWQSEWEDMWQNGPASDAQRAYVCLVHDVGEMVQAIQNTEGE